MANIGRITLLAAGLAALWFLVPGCSAKRVGEAGPKVVATSETVYEYTIGPEDLLEVDLWKNKELSREVTVRPDGFISLPLVQDVRVAGLTANQAAKVLRQRYLEYFGDPEVTVTVKEANSFKVYVLGRVAQPGAFTVKVPVTVLQAISMAGGFTPFANQDSIVIVRVRNGEEGHTVVRVRDILRGTPRGINPVLRSGDTVVIP